MNRVIDKHLQAKIDWLNKITGSPAAPYVNGKAQTGCYHLSHAYGGVCLHRMHNEAGGVSSPLSTGHVSKRELAGLLDAFIKGIVLQQEATDDDDDDYGLSPADRAQFYGPSVRL